MATTKYYEVNSAVRQRGTSPSSAATTRTSVSNDVEAVGGLFDKAKDVDPYKYINRPVIGRVFFPIFDVKAMMAGLPKKLIEDANWHSRLLMLIHIGLTLLFLVNGLAALFCGIFWVKENRPLQVVTEQFNSASEIWYASLDKAGNFKDPFLLAACSFMMAVFHAVHIWPLKGFYDGMIMQWTKEYEIELGYNAFRWIGKGIIGGGFMFAAQHMLGSLDVTSLSYGWLVFAGYCMAMLIMEMLNPVEAIKFGSPPEKVEATAWFPFACAIVAITAWVAVTTAFFAISIADAGIKHYPIYLIVLYCFVLVLCAIEVVMHGLRHGQRVLRKYVWIEYPSILLDTVLFIGITLIIVLGAGLSKK